MEPILTIRDLDFHYGEIHALDHVNFDVYPGEIVAMIGSNGAGKTTLLRTISGLLGKNTGGTISFMGKRIDSMPSHKISGMRLGQVLEGRLVFPLLSVRENLMMGAYLQKDKKFVKDRMEYCYDLFPRLLERENQNAGTLSGGEQQRVSIARALAKNPKLLLCDEPTGALDYNTGKAILKLLQDTCREQGMTVIVITHNSAIAPMADRVIKIKNGKVSEMTVNNNPVSVETIEW